MTAKDKKPGLPIGKAAESLPKRNGMDITKFFSGKKVTAGMAPGPASAMNEAKAVLGNAGPGQLDGSSGPSITRPFLDNVLMSQDVEDAGMHVVWASSPMPRRASPEVPDLADGPVLHGLRSAGQSSDSHQQAGAGVQDASEHIGGEQHESRMALHRRTGPGESTQTGAGTSAGAAPGAAWQDCSEAPNVVGPAGHRLLDHFLRRGSSTSIPEPQQQQDDQVLDEVLAAADVYETPSAYAGAARRRGVGATSVRNTPALGSGLMTHQRQVWGSLQTTGKKMAAGYKRRALLDLLDQVELMVSRKHAAGEGASAPSSAKRAAPSPRVPASMRSASPGIAGAGETWLLAALKAPQCAAATGQAPGPSHATAGAVDAAEAMQHDARSSTTTLPDLPPVAAGHVSPAERNNLLSASVVCTDCAQPMEVELAYAVRSTRSLAAAQGGDGLALQPGATATAPAQADCEAAAAGQADCEAAAAGLEHDQRAGLCDSSSQQHARTGPAHLPTAHTQRIARCGPTLHAQATGSVHPARVRLIPGTVPRGVSCPSTPVGLIHEAPGVGPKMPQPHSAPTTALAPRASCADIGSTAGMAQAQAVPLVAATQLAAATRLPAQLSMGCSYAPDGLPPRAPMPGQELVAEPCTAAQATARPCSIVPDAPGSVRNPQAVSHTGPAGQHYAEGPAELQPTQPVALHSGTEPLASCSAMDDDDEDWDEQAFSAIDAIVAEVQQQGRSSSASCAASATPAPVVQPGTHAAAAGTGPESRRPAASGPSTQEPRHSAPAILQTAGRVGAWPTEEQGMPSGTDRCLATPGHALQQMPALQDLASKGHAMPQPAGHGGPSGAQQQHAPATASQDTRAPLLGDRQSVHYLVLEVKDTRDFKQLRLFNEYQGFEAWAYLQDWWQVLEVRAGDAVNVIAPLELSGGQRLMRVTATEGAIVLHPDILLSGTTVVTTLRCVRQAWLQERFASGGGGGDKALIGQMSHELLQRSLRQAASGKGLPSREQMKLDINDIVRSSCDKLLEAGMEQAEAHRRLAQQVEVMSAWLASYMPQAAGGAQAQQLLGGKVEMGHQPQSQVALPVHCHVDEVLDIEESIWAPKYGLKGQLDASLRVTLSRRDPLHGQRTLHGTMASSGVSLGPAPARFQGGKVQGALQSDRPALVALNGAQHQARNSWSAGVVAVQATQQQQPLAHGVVSSETVVVPFEFKSGKPYIGHKAQVLLYLLLIEERYGQQTRTGLLWNNQTGPAMEAVGYNHSELSSLLMKRNSLAAHLAGPAPAPPDPLEGSDAERACRYCGVASACALYLRAAGMAQASAEASDTRPLALSAGGATQAPAAAGRLEGSALGRGDAGLDGSEELLQLVRNVKPSWAAFFGHWVRLVDLEEAAARAGQSQMWALAGQEREELGGCIAGLRFRRYLGMQEGADGQRHAYLFERQAAVGPAPGGGSSPSTGSSSLPATSVPERVSLMAAGFAPGDMALLGVEARHTAAARVTVGEITQDTIVLLCKKPIRIDKLSADSEGAGNTAVGAGPGTASAEGGPGEAPWRLDKDEAASTFNQMRGNLAVLCGPPGAPAPFGGDERNAVRQELMRERRAILDKLRRLVVDLDAPQLGTNGYGCSSQISCDEYVDTHMHEMNEDQVAAVQRVLTTPDYATVLGMPGTGKTTTIVHIVQALLDRQVHVLVAAYTNSAVDNILLKLQAAGVAFVRLGSAQSVHPALRGHMPGGEHYPDTSVEGLRATMDNARVVGCTCLSALHPLLANRRAFGMCILDEASQVTLPATLAVLALAHSFLLVGDHYQLSPLVISPAAALGGLGVSLFRRLSEAHPQAMVTLCRQYRMAADIMLLSNQLVYNGKLQCGSEQVANSLLRLPNLQACMAHTGAAATTDAHTPAPLPGWCLAALAPQQRVVFLDTDPVLAAREASLKEGVSNPGEAALVAQLVQGLLAAGAAPSDIGVGSPYKAQVALLQQSLQPQQAPAGTGGGLMEVLTLDKWQGRDKPVVLLSFVRSNAGCSAGRLLADWQRINVAVTRAKAKLVMVGSASTLCSVPILEQMLRLLRQRGWLQQLPADCLEGAMLA